MSLQLYVNRLSSLNAARANGRISPHKVCMMLAVADLIESGVITDNKVYFDEKLANRFSFYFEQLKQGNDKNTPYLPFHHLQSEKFWRLIFNNPNDENSYFEGNPSKGKILKYVSYAELDIQLFEYLKAKNSAIHLRAALSSNIVELETQFIRWMRLNKRSESTISKYASALKGSLSKWACDAKITDRNLVTMTSYFEYKAVATKLRNVEEFKQKDKSGKGMYSAALNWFEAFLSDVTQLDIQTDIEEIIAQPDISNTTKAALVNTRIGQGQFRQNLIELWNGCAVTQYANYSLLIASHIKPWKAANNTERLDKYNGLLLLANLDKAFDRGYISFEDDGKIRISTGLQEPEVLGITSDMQINLKEYNRDYLAYHREQVYESLVV